VSAVPPEMRLQVCAKARSQAVIRAATCKDRPVKLRLGITMWILSWVPYGLIFGLSGASLTIAWTVERQLDAAVTAYTAVSPAQQAKWTAAYEKAVANAAFDHGHLTVPSGLYGPVGPMISGLTSMARSGALDGALLSSRQFYGTDYTKPLLFIADGSYLANLAQGQHLSGDQWGMMNETGNYPGQAWLWLYTLWYQVPPMTTSTNADLQVWGIMMVLTVLLALIPFIPGLRSTPRWTRVYRLIWRRHYRDIARAPRDAMNT
jgi:hypothetical protein